MRSRNSGSKPAGGKRPDKKSGGFGGSRPNDKGRKPGNGAGRPEARSRGSSRALAMDATPAGKPLTPLQLKSARRKGEWFELRLPESLAQAPAAPMLRLLPIPPKLAGKLLEEHGVIKNGSLLRLKLFPKERPGMESDFMGLNVLYEDDFALVVNKPSGVEVHPSAQGQKGTLAHAVAAYYEATGQPCKVRPIHRLDKETTGPVIYAKNELAHMVFDKAMRDKKIDRLYLAVAEGLVEDNRGVIDKPIGQDRHHSTRRRISDTGEQAITRFEVVERYADHTLLRLKLETGRTHQIRVHLSSIHHPIAGDGMYGGTRRYIHRQALHGEKLIWFHPWTGERMEIRAPLPDDMAKLLKDLERDAEANEAQ